MTFTMCTAVRKDAIMVMAVLALVSTQLVMGQNTTEIPNEPSGDDDLSQTAVDKAVAPVYKMANIFLESVIQPVNLAELNRTLDLSDFNALLDSFLTDWQTWVKHYYAYVICLVFAVIYILALPITGCVICGCRSRGRCGSKQNLMDGKRTKCYRQTCAGLFILICIGMLFGVVCMFLANQMLYEQTEDRGLPNTLKESIARLDNFIDASRYSYDSYLKTELTDKVDSLKDRLANTAGEVQNKVGEQTGLGAHMDTINMYIGQLNNTKNNLIDVDTTVNDIKSKTTTLSDKLTQLNTNITGSFSSCTTPNCEMVKTVSSTLETVADFSSVGSLATEAQAFTDALTDPDSIISEMQKAQASYNQIQDAVTTSSGALIATLVAEADKVIGEIDTFLNKSMAKIQDISLDSVKASVNNTVAPKIEQFGRYRYYAGIVISSLVLLIVTLSCFGLLFGACGSRMGDSTECCNKGTAASMLKAALVAMFIFSWIIMAIIAVLFPLGGIAHNDICRNLMLPAPDQASSDVIDGLVVNSLSLPVSFMDLYQSCENEEALYMALQLQNQGQDYDLSKILNPDNYNIRGNLDQLNATSYDPGTMDIVNTGLKSHITDLSTATGNIDLSQHTTQLDKAITSHDLQNFADQLKTAAMNSTDHADLFTFYATTVEAIHNTEYSNLEQSINILKDLVFDINYFGDEFNATETILLIEAKQDTVTPAIMSSAVTSVTTDLVDRFGSLLGDADLSIRSKLARCGPVASIISEVIDGLCVNILHPFNAFWFSTGWCLMFFIFIIPISVILINFYRKRLEYDPDTLERASATSTEQLFGRGNRQGSNKYRSRPLPDPMTTETRGGRIPYAQLPAVSGARASPQSQSRDGWDKQPEGLSRNGWSRNQSNDSPRSYDREWTNLAYDDSQDPTGYQWTADSHDPYRGNSRDAYNSNTRDNQRSNTPDHYRGASRDPYLDNQRNDYRSNRRTMYPDEANRW